MTKISETELAAPVVQWLTESNWNVYQEVQFPGHGGVADIVAERHGILWIIECKTTYSFTVLMQASRWPVHYRSVAVPKPKSRDSRDYQVAKNYYQVGVIEVNLDFQASVYEIWQPKLFVRHRYDAKQYRQSLTELHKTYAPAGTPGGYHLTQYRQTMLEIQKFIQNNPGCTIKDLYNGLGEMHYSGRESFQGNVLKCLASFESKWCRIDRSGRSNKLYIRK